MEQFDGQRPRRKIAKGLGCVAAALFLSAVALQSDPAEAAHAGGGGSHGGGFHGGGSHAAGFHGGGFHGGGFAADHNGFGRVHIGHFGHFANRGGFGWSGPGFAVTYPYLGDYYYPDYGYYENAVPYADQYWYYCADPSGYYPYVTQCYSGWQAVPAG